MKQNPNIIALVEAAKKAAGGNTEQAKLSASQAVLESGLLGGGSTLSNKHNNFFGIKGKGPAGSVNLPTKEYSNGQYISTNSPFRAYNSPEESFTDHENLFKTNKRYKKVIEAPTFEEKAQRVKEAGYATDPNYSNKLVDIYNRNLAPYFDGKQATSSRPANSLVTQVKTYKQTPPVAKNNEDKTPFNQADIDTALENNNAALEEKLAAKAENDYWDSLIASTATKKHWWEDYSSDDNNIDDIKDVTYEDIFGNDA